MCGEELREIGCGEAPDRGGIRGLRAERGRIDQQHHARGEGKGDGDALRRGARDVKDRGDLAGA